MKIEDLPIPPDTLLDLLKTLDLFREDALLDVHEIGDGNINRVFRVQEIGTDHSVILKYADSATGISKAFHLNPNRGRTEAEALTCFQKIVPHRTAKILGYAPAQGVLALKDYKDIPVLRDVLLQQKQVANLGVQLAEFLTAVATETGAPFIPEAERAKMRQTIGEPTLLALTEDLVFTAPFYDAESNLFSEENRAFVRQHLYENEPLQREVRYLKNRFLTREEALIHGDLHFGSVFVGEQGVRVFDGEFAMYGSIGYDLGNLIAHFLIVHSCVDDASYKQWIAEQLWEMISSFCCSYGKKLSACLGEEQGNAYLNDLLQDALGFAGTECIRRTVGLAKTKLIDSIKGPQRVRTEKDLIRLGEKLILHRADLAGIGSFEELVAQLKNN